MKLTHETWETLYDWLWGALYGFMVYIACTGTAFDGAAMLAIYAMICASHKDVRDDETGLHLLRRWHFARFPAVRVYLHNLRHGDIGRYPHNHPWRWCWSIILRGGYLEKVWRRVTRSSRIESWWQEHRRGDLNRINGDTYHQIMDVHENTWTLFIAVGFRRGWGWLTPNGHVPYVPSAKELAE